MRLAQSPRKALPPGVFDDRFFKGHAYQGVVAAKLRERGIPAECKAPEPVIPRDGRHKVGGKFDNEVDLWVGSQRVRVEVKSHSELTTYTGPQDFPHPWALVDVAHCWDRKTPTPVATVLISQVTRGICVVHTAETRADWQVQLRWDSVSQMRTNFYAVRRERLASFDRFVAWLLRIEAEGVQRAAALTSVPMGPNSAYAVD